MNFITPSLDTLNGSLIETNKVKQLLKLRFEPTHEMCNPIGVVQGGFVTAMLDDASGLYCMIMVKRDFITSQLSVDFFKSVKPGEPVIAVAKMIRIGLRQAVLDVELVSEGDGRLLARATVYQMFLDLKKKD